jgi:hypothetical protein
MNPACVPQAPSSFPVVERRTFLAMVPGSLLAALARRIDAQYGALEVADVAAQGRILEAAMPEYRQLANEAARQAFLADLRRRGVFQTPWPQRGRPSPWLGRPPAWLPGPRSTPPWPASQPRQARGKGFRCVLRKVCP